MKKILLICLLALLVGGALGYGSYALYKAHVKQQFMNQCVSDLLKDHKTGTITPEQHNANVKLANKLCDCIYDKTEVGMPRFMAELACAFQILMTE